MVLKKCPICGEVFRARTRNKVYCTLECSRKSQKSMKAERENRVIPEKKPPRKSTCKYKRALFENSDNVGYPHLKAIFEEHGLTNTDEITTEIARAYVNANHLKL